MVKIQYIDSIQFGDRNEIQNGRQKKSFFVHNFAIKPHRLVIFVSTPTFVRAGNHMNVFKIRFDNSFLTNYGIQVNNSFNQVIQMKIQIL